MDWRKFLKLSRELREVDLGADKYDLFLLRYSFFYDASSKKQNCKYAQLCIQKFIEENEKEIILSRLARLKNTENFIERVKAL